MRQLKPIIIMFLLCSHLNADATKTPQIDENKAPQVSITEHGFIFKNFTISLFGRNNQAYLVFNFNIMLDKQSSHLVPPHEDIPLIIDVVISDLTTALETFWNGTLEGMEGSLQTRLTRILKAKFQWITEITVSDIKVQTSTASE